MPGAGDAGRADVGRRPGPARATHPSAAAGSRSALTLEETETRWAEVFHQEYYPVWEGAPAEQIDALMQQLASSGRVAPSFGLYGLGQLDLFGVLEIRGRKVPDGLLPPERSEAWKSLDVSLLHTLLVDPLVEESGRPRADVLSYTRDPQQRSWPSARAAPRPHSS